MSSATEGGSSLVSNSFNRDSLDSNLCEVDREEKQRLIKQVLELQHTLVDLSKRVDAVKEENANLRTANQILGQYIEKLMATSSIFQSSSPPPPSQQSYDGGHSISASPSAPLDSINSAVGGFQYEEGSELASEDDIA